MLREEILALEAGRELDQLVGQYVIKFEDYLKEFGKRPMVRDGRYGKNYFDLPAYSSDISAAWEVVEKMDAQGWDFTLERHRFMQKDIYTAIFGSPYRAKAKTAPEAICKAALIALLTTLEDESNA